MLNYTEGVCGAVHILSVPEWQRQEDWRLDWRAVSSLLPERVGAQEEHGWSPGQRKHSLASPLGTAKLQGSPHNFLKSVRKEVGREGEERGERRKEEGRRGGEERREGGGIGGKRRRWKMREREEAKSRRVLLSSNYRSWCVLTDRKQIPFHCCRWLSWWQSEMYWSGRKDHNLSVVWTIYQQWTIYQS